KARLSADLPNYWDDSLKVQKIQQFGILYKIKNPPVFDSANIARSITFMNAYLNSQGYYYAGFTDSVRFDTVRNQIRANIKMFIDVGKNITIDSVRYQMADSNLQQLTMEARSNTLLTKGAPYTKQLISSELDRLVSLYRQHGYFRFTREDVMALVDTMDTRLLQLSLDPFKQAEIIAEAARMRRENPTWKVTIFRPTDKDSSHIRQYYIGRQYFYPETKVTDQIDSLRFKSGFLEEKHRSITMRYKKGLFNYRPLRENSFMRSGELYDESNYYKSINTLGQLGAWDQVDAIPVVRDKDSLDIYFFLVPAIKQSITVNQEVSLNTSDIIGQTNLWGISTNLTYNNRNVWKSAIQSVANLRAGVELNVLTNNGQQFLQTFLVNLGHTYAFPKLIQPFKNWRALNRLDNKRTLFSINGNYIDRRGYYQLRSLTTSWGYEWKKGNNVWYYKPLNLELYALDTLDGLRQLFQTSPALRNSFNSGKVLSQTLSFVRNFNSLHNPNISHYIRFGIEEAGGLFGLIGGLRNQIYRFLKVEGEYRQSIQFQKTQLAMRAYAGVGYNYGSDTARDRTLPFFKQFTAGGPFSMRAWALRQLGLGSSHQSESDPAANSYRDRFGDMQLEANIEYRFPITTIAGFKVSSAVFTDMGNIWNVKNNPADPAATFRLKNLGHDLAIGVGTGLRMDFSYFLLRLDFAYKLKDPGREYNDGWARRFEWTETRNNGLKINNYAFQLGMQLPF
ncbi:MAG TPA: BamA/TamA family outer membrane protein, partial [Sediminibacterium sp.]|nr:BamA/TamA family outer membrane protein [Sediminibacterium sp.]